LPENISFFVRKSTFFDKERNESLFLTVDVDVKKPTIRYETDKH